MMKRVLLVLFVLVAVLAGVVALFIVTRPKAPQRDYMAEFDAMVAQRFPDGGSGVPDFEALVELDRYAQVEAIAKDSVERAIERAAAEGLAVDLIEVEPLVEVVLRLGEEPARWPEDETQRVTAERVLEEARAEARQRVLERLMAPAWRSAVVAFAAHDTVIMPTTPGPSLFDRLLPHLASGRGDARADAVVVRLSDDESARLEALRSMLAMARASATSPTVIGGLVQTAIEAFACEVTLEAVAGRGAPIRDPSAWLAEFDRHAALRTDASWHFEGERLGRLDIIDAEYNKRPGAMRLNTPTTLPVVGVSHGRMYAILNEFDDSLAAAVALPAGERGDALPDTEAFVQSVDLRARPMLETVLPALAQALYRFDRAEAELIGTRAALALAAYRADHGAWPVGLERLVPDYLDAVPIDPFAAADTPMRYEVRPDGSLLLYSLGPDGKDDGGTRPEEDRDLREWGDLVFLPRED